MGETHDGCRLHKVSVSEARQQLADEQRRRNVHENQRVHYALLGESERSGRWPVDEHLRPQGESKQSLFAGKCPQRHGTVHLQAELHAHRHARQQNERACARELAMDGVVYMGDGVPRAVHLDV